MKFAVLVFPGSNCDLDLFWAIKEIMGQEAEYVRHDAESLDGYDGVLIPGGFLMGIICGVEQLRVFQALFQKLFGLQKKENRFLVHAMGFKFY